MEPSTANRLLALNQEFYQTFAVQFSATRQRLQNGVYELLNTLISKQQVLDIGCGNGELVKQMAKAGFAGVYVGLDFSPELVASAEQTVASMRSLPGFGAEFMTANLGDPNWDQTLEPEDFEAVTAFAVLHHIPGSDLRRDLLRRIHRLLVPQGWLMLSAWQVLNAPRLQEHILSWDQAGFRPEELDPGDLLMDWRAGGSGLRYVHHLSSAELRELAAETGFQVVEEYTSDGKEGDLGLYQVWRKV